MGIITPVISLEDLLSFRERRFCASQATLSGDEVQVELIDRSGPDLFGNPILTRIAPHRAKKPKYGTASELEEIAKAKALVDQIREIADCPFCPHNIEQETPKPKIRHAELYTPSGREVVSIPNISLFTNDHLLTIFADHIKDLRDLTYTDMINIFGSGYQLALNLRSQGRTGIIDFLNWGKQSGGSVAHPHSQRGSISDMDEFYNLSLKARIVRSLDGTGYDIMDAMIQKIREEYRELVAFENNHIFVHAVWAPRYPHHVQVFFKNVGNILDLDPRDVRISAESMLGIFHALRNQGVTDLNMVVHQSSFSGEPRGLRMHAEIYQRNGFQYGAGESGQLVHVIPTLPEATALAIRNHYQKPIH